MPSFYENSPSSFIPVDLNSVPYVQFKSSRYSVPRTCCFTTVYYKAIGSKLFIYSKERKHICTHTISKCRGSVNQLEEHHREPSGDWITIMESLRRKWNCYSFQHFINGFKKENPRHLCQQLAAVERFLDAEKVERELVSQVMDECCRNYRYRFSQFKVVYQLEKAGRMSAPVFEFNEVQRQDMEVCKKAFQNRCEQQEVIA